MASYPPWTGMLEFECERGCRGPRMFHPLPMSHATDTHTHTLSLSLSFTRTHTHTPFPLPPSLFQSLSPVKSVTLIACGWVGFTGWGGLSGAVAQANRRDRGRIHVSRFRWSQRITEAPLSPARTTAPLSGIDMDMEGRATFSDTSSRPSRLSLCRVLCPRRAQ
ncbi:hypothetical protein LY78DRAFT_332777 [Colletotrichum sublineola]|nr:hypothetical protein LY78DRAFT_332777 [Colletotrichum sublineola]